MSCLSDISRRDFSMDPSFSSFHLPDCLNIKLFHKLVLSLPVQAVFTSVNPIAFTGNNARFFRTSLSTFSIGIFSLLISTYRFPFFNFIASPLLCYVRMPVMVLTHPKQTATLFMKTWSILWQNNQKHNGYTICCRLFGMRNLASFPNVFCKTSPPLAGYHRLLHHF